MANNMPDFDDSDLIEQSRKISSISNSVKKLKESEMRMVSNQKDINRLVSTTNKVIQKLGVAFNAVGKGIKNTTINSARYSKDAIKQYGEALQEDIQLDTGRLRVLTMSGGPVIGYFINQLIKTPTFQNAIGSIKDKISESMSAAGQKFRDMVSSGAQSVKSSISSVFDRVGNVFGRITGRKKTEEIGVKTIKKPETKKRGIFVEKDGEVLYYPTTGRKKKKPVGIPQLQEGGVTGKGGLARLHPAEVVMPVDKLMKMQTNYMEKARKQTVRAVLIGYQKTRESTYEEYEKPFYKRFLDGLFDLKSAIVKDPINLTYRLKAMFGGLLDKHPVFRFFYRLGRFFPVMAYKILFTPFGGRYRRYVSRNQNPLVATAQTIGSFYPIMTWKMDRMEILMKANLEATRDMSFVLTGIRYPGIKLPKYGRRSLYARIVEGLKKPIHFMWKKFKTAIILMGEMTWKMLKKTGKFILNHPILSAKILMVVGAVMMVRKALKTWAKPIAQGLRLMVDFIKSFNPEEWMKTAVEFWGEKFSDFIAWIRRLNDRIDNWANKIQTNFRNWIRELPSVIMEKFRVWNEKIDAWAQKTEKNLREWLFNLPGNIWRKLTGKITKPINKVTKTVSEVPKKITKPIVSTMDKILGAMKEYKEYLKGVVKDLLAPLNKIVSLITKLLIPSELRKELGDVFSERGEIARTTGVTRSIAETNLARTLKRKFKAGEMSREAFGTVMAGGVVGIGERYSKLKSEGKLIQIGKKIMTSEQRLQSYGLQALAEKEARELKLKAGEIKPKIEEDISKRIKLGKQFPAEAKLYAKENLTSISKDLIPVFKKQAEKAKPYYQQVQEEIFKPIISMAEVAKIKAGEKAEEIKAGLKSNEKFKEGVEEMKKFQGVIVNNFNNAVTSMNNTVSNAINGAQNYRPDLDFSPSLMEIIKGDLD